MLDVLRQDCIRTARAFGLAGDRVIYVHALRVPPNLTSALDAIRWVNWDIAPEEFSIQT